MGEDESEIVEEELFDAEEVPVDEVEDASEQIDNEATRFHIPWAPLQEHLLIKLMDHLPGQRLLCNTIGKARFAQTWGTMRPTGDALCMTRDHFHYMNLKALPGVPENVKFQCQPDAPAEEFDAAGFALSRTGEGEFARDLMQQGYDRLKIGGRLAVSVDNPDDRWVAEEMSKLCRDFSRRKAKRGVVYWSVKNQPLKKLKNFDSEVVFRDGQTLVKLYTRPSVFSHRKLDLGARALLETVEIPPGSRVLDLGSGSGAVALSAAMRHPDVTALATDSNPRAVQCVRRGAEANNVADRVRAVLDSDGASVPRAAFDFVFTNPPYYSQNRISEIFLQIALKALIPGAWLYLVSKRPDWFFVRLPHLFVNITDIQHRGYTLFSAQKR
jgi:16S rRNA (guanine1207-N2)-methyltransferase